MTKPTPTFDEAIAQGLDYFVGGPEGSDSHWYVRKRDYAPEPNVEIAVLSDHLVPNAGEWANNLARTLNSIPEGQ